MNQKHSLYFSEKDKLIIGTSYACERCDTGIVVEFTMSVPADQEDSPDFGDLDDWEYVGVGDFEDYDHLQQSVQVCA